MSERDPVLATLPEDEIDALHRALARISATKNQRLLEAIRQLFNAVTQERVARIEKPKS